MHTIIWPKTHRLKHLLLFLLLLFIFSNVASSEQIAIVVCYCENMMAGKYIQVGHVGVEVLTSDGNK